MTTILIWDATLPRPPARAGGRAGGTLCKGGRYSWSCTTPNGAAGASSSALRPPLTIKPERGWPRSLPRAPQAPPGLR